jgi:hypothetical protein
MATSTTTEVESTEEVERNEDGTLANPTESEQALIDARSGDVDPSVDAQLATGVAPAWATDPTTNKNAAQRYV